MASARSVREFYKDRNVLVTGGSGFMGKVLIEKLLYSVPDIGYIYILMRPKRGKSVTERLEDMQRLPLFHRIKNEKPNAFKKLKVLQGDVVFEDFGLPESVIENISNEVSVVFHFAATLRLEAPLKDNVNMNTAGTLRTLNVARKLKNLAIFVHLSTAFCYPDYEVLGEKIYAAPAQPEQVMQLVKWLDDRQLALITPSLLGPHPNCYTYSKRLAERVVEEAYKHLPIVIARPSIVCPSLKEPVPGWVDNLNGPVGVMLGAGKGVIRTMLCDGSLTAQVIPVDIAINAIIAIGMLEGTRMEKLDIIPVYNVNIGHQKPTTWGEVLNVAKAYGRKYPLSWPLWYPNGDITTNYALHELRRIFYHLVPAYCIDFILFLTGQKRFMVRIQHRISQGLEVLQYFTTRPWSFPCPNYDSIQGNLNDEEKKIFNTDISDVDRGEYMQKCVEGGRVYCLKEDPKNMAINRLYHNFLYVLHIIFMILFWLLILSYFATWFEPVRNVFAIGEPLVKHIPFLGPSVLKNTEKHF
ncbi:putative fatty acyl-CoA reductase CG5065 [Manduca sexta]|uniref:putative fatty acyl-CoA reductase CG5065 n=1 Tax=Manduca sexta TaxID=7130 RepID=UPI00188DE859|nr:putative fatty acyl-CoA reductase CG5065 [Manduca sexta]XP_030031128.2 putative fatty acyl-CoA reductase CG5065 [Manduca sexta]